MRTPIFGLVLVLCALGGAALADSLEMDRLETKDLDLLYFLPQDYLTPHAARSFLNSLEFQRRVFDWEPWERTTVLLKDFSDYGNAAARSSPNNALIIDVAPLSQTFDTFSAAERMFTLMNHEPVHVATMDVWNARDAWWRRFLHGKPMPSNEHPESIFYNYMATPRVNVPRWYLEGSAVFMETWMGGGIGRAQGSYDEMVFRAMVRDDAEFYMPLGLESEGTAVDFQVGVNAYLYGTRFFSYLALTRGPEKVIEWLKRGEDSEAYYADQFEHVFGQSLDSAWTGWIAWEHEFQGENLKAVRQFPVTEGRRLSPRALGSVSRSFYDPRTDTLIGGFRYVGIIGYIGTLNLADGTLRNLTDIKGPMLYRVTSLAYDPDANKAYYTTDNYAYRDLVEVDVTTGRTKMLIRDSRIGDLVVNPRDKSIWGLRHLNGYVTLVRIPPPYGKWNQIHTFAYGDVPYDLDISPDGQLVSMSMSRTNGDQVVRVYRTFELKQEKPRPMSEFNFGTAVAEGFVFSPDGRYLYGSSYYTGVSNIFRYEVATGKVEAVSNAVTGFFRPIPRPDGSLIVYEYTGEGFTPVLIEPRPTEDLSAVRFLGAEIAKAHPVVRTWAVGSPSRVNLEPLVTSRGKYIPSDEMHLAAMYPVISGYKSHGVIGYHFQWEDPMQFTRLYATIGYSWADSLRVSERLHVNVDYHTVNWHLRYWHNDADFYDLFGPTLRSRKGDAFIAAYKSAMIYDPPRQLDFVAEAAFYTGLDQLPANQNVPSTAEEIVSFSTGLHFTDTTKSLGAVDHEKGYEWAIDSEVDWAGNEGFGKIWAGFNYGVPLPWENSSVWTYTSVGFAGGDRFNALTDFYFGGFKNNYVDDKEVKRYREFDTFPGFEIDEINARNFAKSILEVNFPPIRFKDLGTPAIYLGSVRTAAFAGVLWANPDAVAERTLGTVGLQVDLNFTLAHRLPMTFSIGYAAGIEHGEVDDTELMVSLKIM